MPDDPIAEEKVPISDLQTREKWLRDEVTHHRTIMLSTLQWSIAIMAAVESSLYFIRRDSAQGIVRKPFVILAHVLPWQQWFLGTALQFFISLLFTMLIANLMKRFRSYRRQLSAASSEYSKIDDGEVKEKLKFIPLIFLWAFPLFDALFWFATRK